MARVGLLLAVVGLVIWVVARPTPADPPAGERRTWARRGLRVAVVGLCVLWVAAVVALGAL